MYPLLFFFKSILVLLVPWAFQTVQNQPHVGYTEENVNFFKPHWLLVLSQRKLRDRYQHSLIILYVEVQYISILKDKYLSNLKERKREEERQAS